MPHLGEAPGRRRADLQRQAFQRAQIGKALLDLAVALAQRVVLGVRDRRRVVLVVALVVLAISSRMQPRVLGLGLLFGQVGRMVSLRPCPSGRAVPAIQSCVI